MVPEHIILLRNRFVEAAFRELYNFVQKTVSRINPNAVAGSGNDHYCESPTCTRHIVQPLKQHACYSGLSCLLDPKLDPISLIVADLPSYYTTSSLFRELAYNLALISSHDTYRDRNTRFEEDSVGEPALVPALLASAEDISGLGEGETCYLLLSSHF